MSEEKKDTTPVPGEHTPNSVPESTPDPLQKQYFVDRLPFSENQISWGIILLAAVLILSVFGIVGYTPGKKKVKSVVPPAKMGSYDLKLEEDAEFTVTGEFTVSGVGKLSKKQIEAFLTMVPPAPFTVKKAGNNQAVIALEKPRNAGYLAEFRIVTEKADTLTRRVEVNYPALTVALDSTTVSANGAVKMRFSQQVDLYSLKEHLALSPHREFILESDLNNVTLTPTGGFSAGESYRISIDGAYTSSLGKQFGENQILSFSANYPTVTDRQTSASESDEDYYLRMYEEGSLTEDQYYAIMGEMNRDSGSASGAGQGSGYGGDPSGSGGRIEYYEMERKIISANKPLSLSFVGEGLGKTVPVVVTTYQMDNLEKYKEQGAVYLRTEVDLELLEKIDTNAFLLDNGENEIEMNNPGEGGYIIAAKYRSPDTGTDREIRVGYFVTPYTVYAQSSSHETLVWVSNMTDKSPAAGLTVTFSGDQEQAGVTDGDGIVIIPHKSPTQLSEDTETDSYGNTKKNKERGMLQITDSGGGLVYYDSVPRREWDRQYNQSYHSYLYLDRGIYQPEDTISFWGFVRPFRLNDTPLPETIVVTFDDGGLDVKAEVAISPSGIYYGELPLEKIKSSQYTINADLHFPPIDPENKEDLGTRYLLDQSYVSVKEYEKPAYIVTSQVLDDFYGPADEVRVQINASFYDGTPLAQYPVEIFYSHSYSGEWTKGKVVTTDSTGSVIGTFPASTGGMTAGDNELTQLRYRVQIASDGQHITSVGQYRVFLSDLIVESFMARQVNNENVQLTVKTNKVDFASPALIAAVAQLDDPDYTGSINNETLLRLAKGDPVDTSLDIRLRWTYTDNLNLRHSNRTTAPKNSAYIRYDNDFSLDYSVIKPEQMELIRNWENSEKQMTITTKDGQALVKDLIYLPEEPETTINFEHPVTVAARLNFTDTRKQIRNTAAVYPTDLTSGDFWEDELTGERTIRELKDIMPGYAFMITDIKTGDDLTPTESYYRYVDLDIGQQVEFQLCYNGVPVEEDLPILYTVVQGNTYEHRLVKESKFVYLHKAEYGSGLRLVASCLTDDGADYITQLDLDTGIDSLGLNVEVTPDKESYRPGEQVTLRVEATDNLGSPVPGEMVISVVDESIFALAEQSIDLTSKIHEITRRSDNWVTLYSTYRTQEDYRGGWDGGKGSGGGVDFYDSYRSNFKDTAVFLPVATDSSGTAVVTFPLPDNTTSWRITALSVGNNLLAGHSKSNLISSLPFFVRPVMTTKYIDGDDIALLVQGHGTLLEAGDKIDYTVTIKGDGVNHTLTATGEAYQPWEFNFGPLPIGSYTVVSKGQYSGYSDTVELPLHVMKSNLELVVHKEVNLNDKLDIDAMRYPVSLTVYNDTHTGFMASVNSLFGHYCMQLNQRMSRYVAKKAIDESILGGEAPYYIADGNDSVADLQNSDGGISPNGGGSDLLATSYMAQLASDQFNIPLLKDYFSSFTNSSNPKNRAAAYLGLAKLQAVKPEVLIEELQKPENDRPDVIAYYIAGLAYLGEMETARPLYTRHCAPLVTNLSTAKRDGKDGERDLAAIWIAASLVNEKDADALALFFSTGWQYRTLFETMIYVTNFDRQVSLAPYDYSYYGQVTRVTPLVEDGTLMQTFVLNKTDLENLSFYNLPDSIRGVAHYVGEPTELGYQTSENMSITKEIKALDSNTYEVTLVVTLAETAPTGTYDISDWIPSNSRLYSFEKRNRSGSTSAAYSHRQEGQKLYLSFENKQPTEKELTFTYQIRQTYQASAALDTTYMIHGETGESAQAKKAIFTPENTDSSDWVVRRIPAPQPKESPPASTQTPSSSSSSGSSASTSSSYTSSLGPSAASASSSASSTAP